MSGAGVSGARWFPAPARSRTERGRLAKQGGLRAVHWAPGRGWVSPVSGLGLVAGRLHR